MTRKGKSSIKYFKNLNRHWVADAKKKY